MVTGPSPASPGGRIIVSTHFPTFAEGHLKNRKTFKDEDDSFVVANRNQYRRSEILLHQENRIGEARPKTRTSCWSNDCTWNAGRPHPRHPWRARETELEGTTQHQPFPCSQEPLRTSDVVWQERSRKPQKETKSLKKASQENYGSSRITVFSYSIVRPVSFNWSGFWDVWAVWKNDFRGSQHCRML